ncbi:hypothetical protein WV31_07330 [Magnetospirillum sp. ME-1]|uniref:hypothetical protein n=1 Tax=Magnetospirillum sp. ME-1 TaxID=1639348 RepID=UPI000A17A8B7|nr:hypothetical protein [Magnetospirillum sp. ME-1]ARJ65476.1 hypothetical protein WV31_07330 [Magnetospirillum sp. ME-1]
MSADELNTLRAEVAVEAAAEVEAAVPAPEPPPVAEEGLVSAMGMMVKGLSGPLCRRANVTGLDDAEAAMMGAAIAQLVTVYDIGPKDPKGAAWMGFGMAAIGILGNRRPLAPPQEIAAQPVDAPPPPAFGQPGQVSLSPLDAMPCA